MAQSAFLPLDSPHRSVFPFRRVKASFGLGAFFRVLKSKIRGAWVPTEASLDGFLFEPHGHPRAFGSTPRFLGHYVPDLKIIPLEQAARKITSVPAQRQGLENRGLLKKGFFADVTVFDPSTTAAKATYTEPAQLSQGVKYVLVNDQIEFADGQLTEVKAGRPLLEAGATSGLA